MEYTTPHTPQLNGVVERIFSVIKEGTLAIILSANRNDTYQKMMWAEAVHTCKYVRNSMGITGSTTSPFENLYGEKPKIIGTFSEFESI